MVYTYHINEWGALGDGTDQTVKIQSAFDALAPTGGTLLFDTSGQYGVSATVRVVSDKVINLVSKMAEVGDSCVASGFLFPCNAIAGGMVEYASPPGVLSGGGTIDGLTFYGGNGNFSHPLEQQRSHMVGAGLKLSDFVNSAVRNCAFNRIKGCAIRAEFMVKSRWDNLRAHYCGDAGKPAWMFEARSAAHYAQGNVATGLVTEVTLGSYSMYLDPRSQANTFIGGLWETAPEVASTSTQPFVLAYGARNIMTGQQFNRNSSHGVVDWRVNRGVIDAIAAGHPNKTMLLSGNYNRVNLVVDADCSTAPMSTTGSGNIVNVIR